MESCVARYKQLKVTCSHGSQMYNSRRVKVVQFDILDFESMATFCFNYRSSAYACRARYCFTNSVCLSVCLSNASSLLCLNEWTYRHTCLRHSSFLTSPPLQNSKGNPFSEGVNTTEWENFAKSPFISETVRDRAIEH